MNTRELHDIRTSLPDDAADFEPLRAIWATFARMRRGTAYQPTAAHEGEDLNGCIPKRDLLLASGYRFGGARVLSLGANAGFYEQALARASYSRARRRIGSTAVDAPTLDDGPLAAIDLVDIDAEALATASRELTGPAVRDVRTFACAAEQFAFQPGYDICLFLSLFHHYDRLGGVARQAGIRMLREIGRCCQTLFFETGQSDDTVHGSEVWRSRVEMSEYASPASWLENVVPHYTGYTGFRYLGTNPRTNRRLCAYWHERALPARVFRSETGQRASGVVTVRVTAENGLRFEIDGGGPSGTAASILHALGSRPLLVDCDFTRPSTIRGVCANAAKRLSDVLRSLRAATYAIVVHDPAALRFFPRSIPAVVEADASADDPSLILSATRYEGGRVVRIDARHVLLS